MSWLPLAISRSDIAEYVNALFLVYIIIIFVRILLSWVPRMPYNPVLRAVTGFVEDVSDPYLNLFRRFIPPLRMGPGALDLSPIIATFVLLIVGGIVASAIRG
jgi:YggT family protein